MFLIYFEAENKHCHWYPFYLLPSNCYLFNDSSDDDNKEKRFPSSPGMLVILPS